MDVLAKLEQLENVKKKEKKKKHESIPPRVCIGVEGYRSEMGKIICKMHDEYC